MSGLIKSGSAMLRDRVRPLAAPLPVKLDPERERLAERVEALDAELAVRDETIVRLQAEVEQAHCDGEAEGREAGRQEVEDASAQVLATIEDAAEQALARFAEELGAMEGLAALLAQTCLDRLLLASEARSSLVCDLIRGQARALASEALVRVTVSASDFPSPEALAAVSAALGGRGGEIVADEALDSGDCRIALRLGTLEIGLGQQWGSLRVALDAAIGTGAAA